MEHPSPNPLESASAGHELTDVQPSPILIFAISLLVTLGIVYLLGWAALAMLDRVENSRTPSACSRVIRCRKYARQPARAATGARAIA